MINRRELDARLSKDSKNILFIFECENALKYFRNALNPTKDCILVTENSSIVGLRYCMYKFLSNYEVENFVREIRNERNRQEI
jgi:hypothetical protein